MIRQRQSKFYTFGKLILNSLGSSIKYSGMNVIKWNSWNDEIGELLSDSVHETMALRLVTVIFSEGVASLQPVYKRPSKTLSCDFRTGLNKGLYLRIDKQNPLIWRGGEAIKSRVTHSWLYCITVRLISRKFVNGMKDVQPVRTGNVGWTDANCRMIHVTSGLSRKKGYVYRHSLM
jgi:hypothetical protein